MTPIIDLIISGSLIFSGLVCNGQRSRFEDTMRGSESAANEYGRTADRHVVTGNYMAGMAERERNIRGKTAAYWSFKNESDASLAESQRLRGEQNVLMAEYRDNGRTASLYQGMTVTSMVLGGVFLIKAIIGFSKEKEQKSDWTLKPAKGSTGVLLARNF